MTHSRSNQKSYKSFSQRKSHNPAPFQANFQVNLGQQKPITPTVPNTSASSNVWTNADDSDEFKSIYARRANVAERRNIAQSYTAENSAIRSSPNELGTNTQSSSSSVSQVTSSLVSPSQLSPSIPPTSKITDTLSEKASTIQNISPTPSSKEGETDPNSANFSTEEYNLTNSSTDVSQGGEVTKVDVNVEEHPKTSTSSQKRKDWSAVDADEDMDFDDLESFLKDTDMDISDVAKEISSTHKAEENSPKVVTSIDNFKTDLPTQNVSSSFITENITQSHLPLGDKGILTSEDSLRNVTSTEELSKTNSEYATESSQEKEPRDIHFDEAQKISSADNIKVENTSQMEGLPRQNYQRRSSFSKQQYREHSRVQPQVEMPQGRSQYRPYQHQPRQHSSQDLRRPYQRYNDTSYTRDTYPPNQGEQHRNQTKDQGRRGYSQYSRLKEENDEQPLSRSRAASLEEAIFVPQGKNQLTSTQPTTENIHPSTSLSVEVIKGQDRIMEELAEKKRQERVREEQQRKEEQYRLAEEKLKKLEMEENNKARLQNAKATDENNIEQNNTVVDGASLESKSVSQIEEESSQRPYRPKIFEKRRNPNEEGKSRKRYDQSKFQHDEKKGKQIMQHRDRHESHKIENQKGEEQDIIQVNEIQRQERREGQKHEGKKYEKQGSRSRYTESTDKPRKQQYKHSREQRKEDIIHSVLECDDEIQQIPNTTTEKDVANTTVTTPHENEADGFSNPPGKFHRGRRGRGYRGRGNFNQRGGRGRSSSQYKFQHVEKSDSTNREEDK